MSRRARRGRAFVLTLSSAFVAGFLFYTFQGNGANMASAVGSAGSAIAAIVEEASVWREIIVTKLESPVRSEVAREPAPAARVAGGQSMRDFSLALMTRGDTASNGGYLPEQIVARSNVSLQRAPSGASTVGFSGGATSSSGSHRDGNSVRPDSNSNATWRSAPSSGDWTDDANWNSTAPNGAMATATFSTSGITAISVMAQIEVAQIVFNGASAFTITATPGNSLTMSGSGISNSSGKLQNFVTTTDSFGNAGLIGFTNSASAGTMTRFTNNGATIGGEAGTNPGGATTFAGSATAAAAAFENYGGTAKSANPGRTSFYGSSDAGSATVINHGGTALATRGGQTEFFDSASAMSATFSNTGGVIGSASGGGISFRDNSKAGTARFTNDAGTVGGAFGGVVHFFSAASADHATFTNRGATVMDAISSSVIFSSNSTADHGIFLNEATAVAGSPSASTNFFENTTAASAMITNRGGAVSGWGGGETNFDGSANGGSATFLNEGGTVAGSDGGLTSFATGTSAASSTITNSGATVAGAFGGKTAFAGAATANAATLIANGGTNSGSGGVIQFRGNSTGGTSRVEVFGNGYLDLTAHDAAAGGVSIGSLEGSGNVLLSASGGNLTVGTNNASTTFSGVLQDNAGPGATLTKVGTGTLTLSGTNSYQGSTTISSGTLAAAGTGTNRALNQTSLVVVNNGGTLLMGANDQFNASTPAPVGLGGGSGSGSATFDAGGFSQGSATTVGVGALSLLASGVIDLTGNSLLHFAPSTMAASGAILSVLDWNGLILGGGTEMLKFGNSNSDLSYLSQIQFVNPGGLPPGTYAAMFATADPGEIVPGGLVPVPEPATWFAAALTIAGIACGQRQRFCKSRRRAA